MIYCQFRSSPYRLQCLCPGRRHRQNAINAFQCGLRDESSCDMLYDCWFMLCTSASQQQRLLHNAIAASAKFALYRHFQRQWNDTASDIRMQLELKGGQTNGWLSSQTVITILRPVETAAQWWMLLQSTVSDGRLGAVIAWMTSRCSCDRVSSVLWTAAPVSVFTSYPRSLWPTHVDDCLYPV